MKKLLHILFLVTIPSLSFSQARIVFNGANIYITNNAVLVIDNPAPDAMTNNGSGGIVSEGANNNLIWNLGVQAATYKIPFVSGNNPIPVIFTTSGGTGNGGFKLSTYAGPDWQNSNYLPPGVTRVDRDGTDNSAHVIDRFWQINPFGYSTLPTLSNLSFSYTENEWNEAGNSIIEGNLEAQNWNNVSNSWLVPPVGLDDPSLDQVVLTDAAQTHYYPWWTLVSSDYALPLNLLNFTAEKYHDNVLLQWLVTAEFNVNFYEVQRSANGNDFVPIGRVASASNANTQISYTYRDTLTSMYSGILYYRLRMVDMDGKFSYSPVKWLSFRNDNNGVIQISPNPVTNMAVLRFGDVEGPYEVSIFNAEGRRLLIKQIMVTPNTSYYFPRESNMGPGVYIYHISGGHQLKAFSILYQ